jgi:hypothetical protein
MLKNIKPYAIIALSDVAIMSTSGQRDAQEDCFPIRTRWE